VTAAAIVIAALGGLIAIALGLLAYQDLRHPRQTLKIAPVGYAEQPQHGDELAELLACTSLDAYARDRDTRDRVHAALRQRTTRKRDL
jgi:hypothetical protein